MTPASLIFEVRSCLGKRACLYWKEDVWISMRMGVFWEYFNAHRYPPFSLRSFSISLRSVPPLWFFLTDAPRLVFESARISLLLLIRRFLAEDIRFCFPCGVSIETVSEYSQYSDWREGKWVRPWVVMIIGGFRLRWGLPSGKEQNGSLIFDYYLSTYYEQNSIYSSVVR